MDEGYIYKALTEQNILLSKILDRLQSIDEKMNGQAPLPQPSSQPQPPVGQSRALAHLASLGITY
jgi:hypothetical protein